MRITVARDKFDVVLDCESPETRGLWTQVLWGAGAKGAPASRTSLRSPLPSPRASPSAPLRSPTAQPRSPL